MNPEWLREGKIIWQLDVVLHLLNVCRMVQVCRKFKKTCIFNKIRSRFLTFILAGFRHRDPCVHENLAKSAHAVNVNRRG